MQIQDAVAIVTGGASGIGRATVRQLIQGGARGVAVFDLNREGGEQLVDEIGDERLSFHSVDVTDGAAVTEAVQAVTERWGQLDICCNFAGIAPAQKTVGRKGAASLDTFRKVVDINLVGSFNVSRLAALAMSSKEDGVGTRGVIINTASAAAFEGQIGQVAYSASKGGIVSMTLTMARDLAQYGVRVMAVAPGLIHTPLFDGFSEEVIASLAEQPLHPKRLGKPEEVADLALHIIENDYLNGTCIRVDAGIRMQPK